MGATAWPCYIRIHGITRWAIKRLLSILSWEQLNTKVTKKNCILDIEPALKVFVLMPYSLIHYSNEKQASIVISLIVSLLT